MLRTSVAAWALLAGCASVQDAHPPADPVIVQAVELRHGDRITVKSTDVPAHVCVDDSRLVCAYGSGRLSYVSCECQRAAASPAMLR